MLKSLLILTLFRVAFVGDPQADNATQVYYARRSVFRELRERKDIDLVVVLGDLVNDEPGLIGPMAASLDSLPCPWVAVPGNHDRDVYRGEKGRGRDVATWRRELGYVDTAFVRGGVKFILMNDVRTKGSADYEAGFSERQKAWLAAELAATPRSQMTVLATHIPLTEMHAQDSLAALLATPAADDFYADGAGSSSGRRLLLVSGHTHQVRRETLTLGSGLAKKHAESLVVGATCGSWWRGFKDALGIPDGLMNCGSPRGYFLADFPEPGSRTRSSSGSSSKLGSTYRLRWSTVSADKKASATATDSTLIVNVFGGHLDGIVKVKGIAKLSKDYFKNPAQGHAKSHAQSQSFIKGQWITLVRRHLIAPEVEERISFNNSMTREYRREHQEEYIPMRRLASPHVWAADVPDASSLRGRKVTVIYSDDHMSFRTRLTVR